MGLGRACMGLGGARTWGIYLSGGPGPELGVRWGGFGESAMGDERPAGELG